MQFEKDYFYQWRMHDKNKMFSEGYKSYHLNTVYREFFQQAHSHVLEIQSGAK